MRKLAFAFLVLALVAFSFSGHVAASGINNPGGGGTSGWSYASPRISLATATDNARVGTPTAGSQSDDTHAKFQVFGDASKYNVTLWAGSPSGSVNLYSDDGSAAVSVGENAAELVTATSDLLVVANRVQIDTGGAVAMLWSATSTETRFGGAPDYPQVITQAATFTLDATTHDWYAASATAQTGTLPDATACPGREYRVKQTGAGQLTLATTSSQTIDGALTYVFPAQRASLDVSSDGANWQIH